MDVIADRGAVRRVEIAAEDRELIAFVIGAFQRQRDHVRFAGMALAGLAVAVCASGVEIAQRDRADAMCLVEVAEDALHHQFRHAVGIDRVLRMRLVDRLAGCVSKSGTGRGEDEIAGAMLAHRFEEVERRERVVAVVDRRFTDGFGDERRAGKVRHGVWFDLRERGLEIGRVLKIAFEQGPPLHQVAPAGGQVVEHGDLPACFRKGAAAMTADIACPACNQQFSWHDEASSVQIEMARPNRHARTCDYLYAKSGPRRQPSVPACGRRVSRKRKRRPR